MAVCPKCGFQNDDQWRYCFKCGSVLPTADAPAAQSYPSANAQVPPMSDYQTQYPAPGAAGARNMPPDPRSRQNQQSVNSASAPWKTGGDTSSAPWKNSGDTASAPWKNSGNTTSAPWKDSGNTASAPRKDTSSTPAAAPTSAAAATSAAPNTSANGESFAPANAEFNPDIFRVLAIVSAVLMGISVFFPFMSLDLKIYKLPIRICDQSSFAALLVAGMGALAVWCAQNKKKWGVVAGGAVCLVVFLLAMSKANNAFSGKTYEFLSEMAEYYVDDIVDFLSGTVMDMVKKGFGYFGLLFSSIATIIFGLIMPSDGLSFSNQDYGRMINEKWQNLKK